MQLHGTVCFAFLNIFIMPRKLRKAIFNTFDNRSFYNTTTLFSTSQRGLLIGIREKAAH